MTTTPPHARWQPPPSGTSLEPETSERSFQKGLNNHFIAPLTKKFRDSIAREMKFVLDAATEPWGVLVERVEVKDVRWLSC